jgi:hypothetical protein
MKAEEARLDKLNASLKVADERATPTNLDPHLFLTPLVHPNKRH